VKKISIILLETISTTISIGCFSITISICKQFQRVTFHKNKYLFLNKLISMVISCFTRKKLPHKFFWPVKGGIKKPAKVFPAKDFPAKVFYCKSA
jgi:hypothetical protein